MNVYEQEGTLAMSLIMDLPVTDPMRLGKHPLTSGERTMIMGIINLTPDSFSGDGLAGRPEAAVAAARKAVTDGADILDLGAESTRPGHRGVPAAVELARLMPALNALRPLVKVPISIDTTKAAVAEAALAAGADLINSVHDLTADSDLLAVAVKAGVPVVLMHNIAPDDNGDVVTSVVRELARRIDRATAAGVGWNCIIVDPGFGFGKDWRQGLQLLKNLSALRVLGRPILAATSRKSMIGKVTGGEPGDRLEGTSATVTLAIAGGASIVRVHDVRAMKRVALMTDAVVRGAPPREFPG